MRMLVKGLEAIRTSASAIVLCLLTFVPLALTRKQPPDTATGVETIKLLLAMDATPLRTLLARRGGRHSITAPSGEIFFNSMTAELHKLKIEESGYKSCVAAVNLAKDGPALEAEDRWCVPDPNKANDQDKVRENILLKEFEEYRASSQKRLKVFRLEAVRAGLKKAWQERYYTTIIAVTLKIPETILKEDSKHLEWYDQMVARAGEE